jgi:hypothetical protein
MAMEIIAIIFGGVVFMVALMEGKYTKNHKRRRRR